MSFDVDQELANIGRDSREEFWRYISPRLTEIFSLYPWLKSISLLVAQYWDDEADDAVHDLWILSRHSFPNLDDFFSHYDSFNYGEDENAPVLNDDASNIPHTLPQEEVSRILSLSWQLCSYPDYYFDDNGTAITRFSAWCHEEGSQDNDASSNFSLCAVVTNEAYGLHVTYQPMIRPWLNGVNPNWE